MQNGSHRVRDRDPAQPLPAAADPATQSQSKRGQHHRQGAAVAIEHDSEAQIHHANSRIERRLRRRLPVARDLRQETGSVATGLREYFVAALSIKTNRRSRQQHRRLLPGLRQGVR